MKRAIEVNDLVQIRHRKYWWKVLGFNAEGLIVVSLQYRPKLDTVNPHLVLVTVYHEELVELLDNVYVDG